MKAPATNAQQSITGNLAQLFRVDALTIVGTTRWKIARISRLFPIQMKIGITLFFALILSSNGNNCSNKLIVDNQNCFEFLGGFVWSEKNAGSGYSVELQTPSCFSNP
jgi:hypothetical protein